MSEKDNTRIESICNNIEQFVVDIGFTTETGDGLSLTNYQADFARNVISRKDKKYMFLACTGGGKTESTSIIAILLAILYDGEKVVVVAPTYRQANKLFMRIRSHILGSKHFLMPLVDRSKPFTRDELHFLNGSSMSCISSGNPEALLGTGASCLIIDESASVDDNVYKTRISRMLVRKIKHEPMLILIGTPHKTDQFFYQAYQSKQFNITRVTWEDAVKAGRLNKEEVEFNRKMMTVQEFACWYEAKFVNLSEHALYNLDTVDRAMMIDRSSFPNPEYDYYMAADIARYGNDETALVIVGVSKKNGLKAPVEMHNFYKRSGFSITESAGWILQNVQLWKPKVLMVDAIGIGAGAMDLLKEQLRDTTVQVRAFDFVGRERSECYIYLKQLLEDKLEATGMSRILLPHSDVLREQFKSYTAKYTSDGRLRIEKTEGVRDDIVDALVMALYPVRMRALGDIDLMMDIGKDMFSTSGNKFTFGGMSI